MRTCGAPSPAGGWPRRRHLVPGQRLERRQRQQVARAVAAPRFHRQDLPDALRHEPGRLDAGAREFLLALGQPIEEIARLGDVNAVFRAATGRWVPVCDPRRSGAAWRVANPPPAPRATPLRR